MWARRLFSHLGVRINAAYVSKFYVTCLWVPEKSAENLNSNLVFDRNISRRLFLRARSLALLCVQSSHSRQSGSVICFARLVATIIWGRANKNERKEVNSGRVFFIHVPRLVLFFSTLSGCMMSRGSILKWESCKLNCNLKR